MQTNPPAQIDPNDAVHLRKLHDALRSWGSNIDGTFRFPRCQNIRDDVEVAESQVRECWAELSDKFRLSHPDIVGEWSGFAAGDISGRFEAAIDDLVNRLPPQ